MKAYRGFRGKAALYSHVDSQATTLGPTSVQLMQTGAYTVRALTCTTCHAYLGFTFVRAHEKSEEWKADHSVLEAASVREEPDPLSASAHLPLPSLEPVRPMTPASAETDMSDMPEEMTTAQARPRRPLPSPHAHASSVWRKTVVKLSSASRLAGSRHSRSISTSTDGTHHPAPWVIE